MLDIKMETFIAVCDYMNFTHAANVLGLTQPAVSRQMKSLEEYYDTPLFYYEGKKLFLTAAGKSLYHYAKSLRNDELKLKEKLKQQDTKHLYIGATPTPGNFMLPAILAQYLKDYPTFKIRLMIQNTGSLLEKIDNGEIDFAVVEGNFSKQDYEYLLFSNQQFLPIGPIDLQFNQGTIEDLLPYTLIVREEGSGNREILEYSLKRYNLLLSDFAGIIETNDIKIQKALVQQGCGVAFLFDAAIEEEKQTIKKLIVQDFPLHHEINIIWRKNSIFQEEYTKLAKYFINKNGYE